MFLSLVLSFTLWSGSQLLGLLGLKTVLVQTRTQTRSIHCPSGAQGHSHSHWACERFRYGLLVRATHGQHHCPILIHYRPTQTCFVNGRCCHTRFSLRRIDAGAPEEGSNGYILSNKNPSSAWGTDEKCIFCFFSHPIIFELLKGPIESIHAVLFLRPEYTAWDVHRGLGLLFQFLGKMDYFLHLLLL